MAIAIPDLCPTNIDYLTACGDIKTKDKALRKWADDHSKQYYIYQLKTTSGRQYCRVSLDSPKTYIHFHVDIAKKEWFKTRRPETSKNTIGFEELVAPFRDQTVNVDALAHLEVPLEQLPSIIHITQRLEITKDGVSMKMTGGQLSLAGSSISAINWTIDDTKNRAALLLKGSTTLRFTDSYFEECLRFITSFSDTFLEKETANG